MEPDEAMMNHRPYRAALGLDASLSEIRMNSGILYDKDVADACAELFRLDGYALDEQEHGFQFPDLA